MEPKLLGGTLIFVGSQIRLRCGRPVVVIDVDKHTSEHHVDRRVQSITRFARTLFLARSLCGPGGGIKPSRAHTYSYRRPLPLCHAARARFILNFDSLHSQT